MLVRCLIASSFVLSLAGTAGAQHLEARPRLTIATPVEKPVALQSVRISAEIGASLAQTSVELAFRNPNARVLEGELAFPLADGQSVTGLALELDDGLRDAVPVEKARARMVFEDVTRQQIDPALVEATAGNQYRLRVYPILPQRSKRVVVRYAETLDAVRGERVYRVPVHYRDGLDSFGVDVVVRGTAAPRFIGNVRDKAAFVRGDDGWKAEIRGDALNGLHFVEVAIPAPAAQIVTERRDGRTYFHAEIPVRATSVPRTLPRVVALAWDSSGSAAGRDHARELALLDAYFRAMRDGEVKLVRFRERAEAPETFAVRRGDWTALRRALEATVYDGATDLGAFANAAGVDEYLLVSDGVATFGDAAFVPGTARVYTIASSPGADSTRLRHIAHATGGRFVDLQRLPTREAAGLLLRDTPRLLDVSGDGVVDVVAASPFPERGRLVIAGTLAVPSSTLRVEVGTERSSSRTLQVPVDGGQASGLAAAAWARLQIAALEGDPASNRSAIRELGKRFGIVTRETSLIVLDRVEDYARHEIEPPRELLAEYRRLRALNAQHKQRDRAAQIERVVAMLRDKEAWWNRQFPKGERPAAIAAAEPQRGTVAPEGRARRNELVAAMPGAAPPLPRTLADSAAPAQQRATAKSNDRDAGEGDAIVVRLARWTPDAPYVARLRDARPEDLYGVYLDERRRHPASTAFFLDAADELFARGQRDLAVRVLGNLAELDLGNRHVLRILGYRLMQAGERGLALPVLRRVLELAPDEPQSFRDLGLAYAADGQCQKAVDTLYEVVRTPWHGRFPDVELIALAELNATVTTCGGAIDTSAIDRRLLRNLPVELRVVLAWDADNTDIDLWVTDPNGERAYYAHPLTYQGGRMSRDFTGGYGPEEFSLKVAKPGRYRVEAHFFGHRQQIVAGATTLQVKFQTSFGTPAMTERSVTLRLQGRGGQVAVGEFDVGAP